MNKKLKMIFSMMLVFIFIIAFEFALPFVKAESIASNDDFIKQAADWYSKGGNTSAADNINSTLTGIVSIINVAGTAIIAIVTVILGMKYMLGSATGKAEVKGQLTSLLVACILFFGWSNLSGILITGAQFNTTSGTYDNISGNTQFFLFDNLTGSNGVSGVLASVFAIVTFIARIVALVVTMYIGVKYIFGGAETKSQIKQRGPMYIVGILMIFCTVGILSFISDIIVQTF